MALTKNTAKAPAKAKEPANAPVKKDVEAKKVAAPAPAAPVASAEDVLKLSRKDLATQIRAKVTTAGAAISERVAAVVVVAYEEAICEAIAKGAQVVLPGFGAFMVVDRAARVGKNPKTGEEITIPASRAPKFKPGSKLKVAAGGGEEAAEGDE